MQTEYKDFKVGDVVWEISHGDTFPEESWTIRGFTRSHRCVTGEGSVAVLEPMSGELWRTIPCIMLFHSELDSLQERVDRNQKSLECNVSVRHDMAEEDESFRHKK